MYQYCDFNQHVYFLCIQIHEVPHVLLLNAAEKSLLLQSDNVYLPIQSTFQSKPKEQKRYIFFKHL